MDSILVLDLGTTNFKASVFNGKGKMEALVRTPTPTSVASDGRREIDVHIFCDTIAGLIQGLDAQRPGILSNVSAITFASQTNSFVLLGENDTPLTPIVLWNDARAIDLPLVRTPDLQHATGIPALTNEFMVAKLLWYRERMPDTLASTKKLCLISDYLTLWLTGKHIAEAGTAGLTGLLDIHALRWQSEAVDHFQIAPSWLPEIVRAGTDLGTLLPERARLLSLPEACRFVTGSLDQYTGAIGVGNVNPGDLSETTGTVLATVQCTDAFQRNAKSGVFQGPAFAPGLYYQMTFGSTAANYLEDFRNALPDQPTFAQLDEEAAAVAPGAEGLVLAPNVDLPTRDQLLTEMVRTHSRGHAVRAILETVSYALKDQVTLLCGSDTPPWIACAGGAARSHLWLQIKADILNTTMTRGRNDEPTSLGAAILARQALSGTPVQLVANAWVQTGGIVSPDERHHRIYTALHAQSD